MQPSPPFPALTLILTVSIMIRDQSPNVNRNTKGVDDVDNLLDPAWIVVDN